MVIPLALAAVALPRRFAGAGVDSFKIAGYEYAFTSRSVLRRQRQRDAGGTAYWNADGEARPARRPTRLNVTALFSR